jgi:LPXTG-motif cell wall-anchored protein
MFNEAAAGAPPAVKVWFYPGESYGYEFAYPHDQAMKIAKATHQPVLSYDDHSAASTTDEGRVASMRGAEVARIDENGKPVSSDEALKESSGARTPVADSSRNHTAVGTAGSAAAAPAPAARPARTHLPRTGSELPLMTLLAGLSLAIGLGLRLARRAS